MGIITLSFLGYISSLGRRKSLGKERDSLFDKTLSNIETWRNFNLRRSTNERKECYASAKL